MLETAPYCRFPDFDYLITPEERLRIAMARQ